MSLPQSTTILIVGAGPAGLAAALSLVHHACRDLVIVDALVEGQNTSRAIAINAATVEALASINAVDGFLSSAIKAKSMRFSSRSSQIIEVGFGSLKEYTAHPYTLLCPQSVTEFVLAQKLQSLGVQVQRPHKVVGMKQNEKDPRITDVSFEDGQIIMARYIIGADGAHSIVRNITGIEFSDPYGPKSANGDVVQLAAADITFDREPVGVQTIEGHLNHIISPAGFFFLVPFGTRFNAKLTGDGKPITKPVFRVGCPMLAKNGEPTYAPSRENLQNSIDTYGPVCMSSDPSINPTPVKIDQLIWSTSFRPHSAIADRIFTRFGAAIFLVGDAAHIHSPMGGQGINLAIRDAIFLGEAVSKHMQAYAENPDVDDTILEEFAEARRARALEIIGYTNGLLKLSSLPYDSYAWWMPFSQASVRDVILRLLGGFKFVQSRIVWNLSGLGRR